MEFFTNRIKITSKWSASYGTNGSTASSSGGSSAKKARIEESNSMQVTDKANFDGRM